MKATRERADQNVGDRSLGEQVSSTHAVSRASLLGFRTSTPFWSGPGDDSCSRMSSEVRIELTRRRRVATRSDWTASDAQT